MLNARTSLRTEEGTGAISTGPLELPRPASKTDKIGPSQHTPSPSQKSKTVRIQSIPKSVTVDELRAWLQELRIAGDEAGASNILQLTLSPINSEHSQGTVTFETAPDEFRDLPKAIYLGPNRHNVAVDEDFHGLTVLHDAKSAANATVDIIAIHGFGGHAILSWKAQSQHFVWFRDFLPYEAGLSNARIMTYGYNTSVKRDRPDSGRVTLDSLSKKMLEAISAFRQGTVKQRPILLMGHSLGGLIIKHALVVASRSLSYQPYKDIFQAAQYLIFFGVPNQGIRFEELEIMLEDRLSLQLAVDLLVDKGDNPKQLLERLNDDFVYHVRGRPLDVLCYYELLPTLVGMSDDIGDKRSMILVSKASATYTGLETRPHNILSLNGDHRSMIKFESRFAEDYLGIQGRISGFVRTAGEPHTLELSEEERECLRSVKLSDPTDTKNKASKKRQPGTCEWIFTRPEYTNWDGDEKTSLLWLLGKPGSGKTVTSSLLLENLEEKAIFGTSCLAYIFCDEKDPATNTATAILRTLIWQLLKQNTSLFKYILPTSRLKDCPEMSLESLWSIFVNMIKDSQIRRAMVLIDALDECEGQSREELLDLLTSIFGSVESGIEKSTTSCLLKLVITSRPLEDIKRQLVDLSAARIDFEDAANEINQDIASFVRNRVDLLAIRRNLAPDLSVKIEGSLLAKADGMFLYAALILEQLGSKSTRSTPQAIVDVLNNLPKTLFEVYDRILENIDPEIRSDVMQLLSWVVAASRPLKLAEINYALAIKPSDKSLSSTQKSLSFDIAGDISRQCGIILKISDGIVGLVHQSAKEFLLNTTGLTHQSYHIDLDQANINIARTSLQYLLFEDFAKGPVLVKDFFDTRPVKAHVNSHAFLNYAANNWFKHTRGQGESILWDILEKFMACSPSNWEAWVQIVSAEHLRFISAYDSVTPLHIAAFFDLPVIAQKLIFNGADPFARDSIGWTPLHRAAGSSSGPQDEWSGSDSVARLLIDRGADPHARGGTYNSTPLHRAAEGTRLEVAKMLLAKGAEVSCVDDLGLTPLHGAVWNTAWQKNDGAVVKLLLDHQASTNCREKENGETPLHIAVAAKSEFAAKLLLSKDATPIATGDNNGCTPLDRAILTRCMEMVELLLDYSIYETFRSGTYAHNSPLEVAMDESSEDILQCLLRCPFIRPTINSKVFKNEGTALHWVVETWSHEKEIWNDATRNLRAMTDMLLGSGASPQIPDKSGKTPLRRAIDSNLEALAVAMLNAVSSLEDNAKKILTVVTPPKAVALLLIDKGADVMARSSWLQYTPLHRAAELRFEEVVEILLDAGADPNAKDRESRTPLHLACLAGAFKAAELLVIRGAAVMALTDDHSTPLHLAAPSGSDEVTHLLLKCGAVVNAEDRAGRTPLDRIAGSFERNQKVVQVLQEYGGQLRMMNLDGTKVHF